ncbi:MAG: hypothetical protein HZB42_10470 [Sphingobacteriales bacterium]|nr:hypothetical protein [Sphingobacteriales bacterium]
MELKQIYKNLSISFFGAGVALLCMVFISLFSDDHVTAQNFEMISSAENYTKGLIAYGNELRLILTFDNIFAVLYTAGFTFLFMALSYKEKAINVTIAFIVVLATGLLDFYENHHILTFITTAEKGVPVNMNEVSGQMTLSQLKFHLSYLSLFLFAFSMPGNTFLERLLKFSLFFLQLPIGVLVYTSPQNMKPVFEILRYSFMLGGLLLIAYNFYLLGKKETV